MYLFHCHFLSILYIDLVIFSLFFYIHMFSQYDFVSLPFFLLYFIFLFSNFFLFFFFFFLMIHICTLFSPMSLTFSGLCFRRLCPAPQLDAADGLPGRGSADGHAGSLRTAHTQLHDEKMRAGGAQRTGVGGGVPGVTHFASPCQSPSWVG